MAGRRSGHPRARHRDVGADGRGSPGRARWGRA